MIGYPKKVYKKKPKKRMMTKAEREALYERTKGVCEWCGKGMRYEDMDDHHRKRRSQTGGWELSNQMGVHHNCHVLQPDSIHQNVKQAFVVGALLHESDDPTKAPVVIGGQWVLLDDDGNIEEHTEF